MGGDPEEGGLHHVHIWSARRLRRSDVASVGENGTRGE